MEERRMEAVKLFEKKNVPLDWVYRNLCKACRLRRRIPNPRERSSFRTVLPLPYDVPPFGGSIAKVSCQNKAIVFAQLPINHAAILLRERSFRIVPNCDQSPGVAILHVIRR